MIKMISKRILTILTALLLGTFLVGFSNSLAEPLEINPLFTSEAEDAYSWLVAQQDSATLDDGTISGLVDSFEDFSAPNTPITMAYTYDQAVAAIAFMTYGDMERAELVLTTMQNLQADDGSWVNSYWYNGYWGAELRKHVGPITWIAVAVRNYEVMTGDTVTYHQMAIDALDYSIQFQQDNGGVAGGETTWDSPGGAWIEEVWTSTEHNLNLYPTLLYFAETTPSKATEYEEVASGVLSFLEDVVWDDVNNRFYGGFKNDTGLVDPYVPLDVNPWAVLALGEEYANALTYIEESTGHPDTGLGTLEYPRYVYTVEYNDAGDTLTGYDFDWQSDNASGDPAWGGGTLGADVWLEGSTFMAGAYYALGNDTKGDEILSEIAKKMADAGSMTGGLPYSVNGTNNNYWRMIQQNCISSTGWFVIISAQWNPYTADLLMPGEKTANPVFNYTSGQYPETFDLEITSDTIGADIYYTLDGSKPTTESLLYSSTIEINESTEVQAIAVSSSLLKSSIKKESYIINPNIVNPVVNILGGTYSYDLNINITTETNDAVIYYTIDGSLPTESSSVYTETLLITETTTLTIQAIRDGFISSDYIVEEYIILDPIDPPVFNVEEGTYHEMQSITLTSNIEDAVIRYTTDGTIPTSNSPIYTGPLLISSSKTIKAITTKNGLGDSIVITKIYTIFNPNLSVTYVEDSSNLTITMTNTAVWADIHISINGGPQQNYRIDNNAETGLPEYLVTGLNTDDLVRFSFTYDPSGGAIDSDWILYIYGSASGEQLTDLNSSHLDDTYTEVVTLELTHDNPNAEIYYALNDVVTEVSTLYTGPFVIDGTTTVQAIAKINGSLDSEILEFTLTIELEAIDNDIPNPDRDPDSPKIPIYIYIVSGVTISTAGIGFFIFKKFKM
jgi:hypothetical protein